MNCPNCGNKVSENQKFCSHCGYNLENNQQDLSNNSEQSWSEKTFGMKPNYGLIFGVLFLVIIFSSLVFFVNKTNNNSYSPNLPQDDQVENSDMSYKDATNANKKDISEENVEEDTYIAPKPKCKYETSNGICFTTRAFKPKPLNYYDCTGGLTTYGEKATPTQEYQKIGIRTCYEHHDYWAGAMKMCSDWGYKVPSAYELGSLAMDIYGVSISLEESVSSYLPDGHSINKVPLEKLNIWYGEMAGNYWEDTDSDEHQAYARYLGNGNNHYTYRKTEPKEFMGNWSPAFSRALCVYDPHGKAKKSYAEYLRQQQIEENKKQKQHEQKEIQEHAEQTLF